MKVSTRLHMLQDPEGQAAIKMFRGVIRWCNGTLLQPEEIKVSVLVTDDLGAIERESRNYSVTIFVCDKDNVGSSDSITSTFANLEHNVYRALASFERREAIIKA
jgi:hypothetical protein